MVAVSRRLNRALFDRAMAEGAPTSTKAGAAPPDQAQPSFKTLEEQRAERIERLRLAPGSGDAKAVKAADILATIDETAMWQELVFREDPKVAFWALQYLTDQREGKPTQRVETKRVSTFEGRTNAELEHFAQHGTWPNSTALLRFGRFWSRWTTCELLINRSRTARRGTAGRLSTACNRVGRTSRRGPLVRLRITFRIWYDGPLGEVAIAPICDRTGNPGRRESVGCGDPGSRPQIGGRTKRDGVGD
jgi:hypothetical protein